MVRRRTLRASEGRRRFREASFREPDFRTRGYSATNKGAGNKPTTKAHVSSAVDQVEAVEAMLRAGTSPNHVHWHTTQKETDRWLRHLHTTNGKIRGWLSERMRSLGTLFRR